MVKEQVRINDNTYVIDKIFRFFNLLKITFSEETIIDGLIADPTQCELIELLTRGGEVYGSFSGYTTVYKIEDASNTVILSNDGSVYVEPDPEPDPDPIPEYVPTIEEIRERKISDLSTICNSMIINGVDIDINGEIEHFSYKAEDQVNIKNAFDLALRTQLDIPYHQNEGSCKLYTAEQIINLYIAQQTNLTHHQTYFNQIKMFIKTIEDKDTVNAISYGDLLTGQYLDAYNAVMTQASVVINTLLGRE